LPSILIFMNFNNLIFGHVVHICYLCGLELISLKGLKLSKEQKIEKIESLKNKGQCITHEEHIIPNALGGYLKSEDVLCEECGSKLNDSIDKKFIENFDFLKKLLDLRVDRSSNKNNQTKAKVYLSKLNIMNRTGFVGDFFI
jgi:hypothetical protein